MKNFGIIFSEEVDGKFILLGHGYDVEAEMAKSVQKVKSRIKISCD